MSNRIQTAIDKTRVQISKANLTAEQIDRTSKAATLDFELHFRFQSLKSEMHANGVLTFEEASTLFALLGGSADRFNSAELAERIVCIKTFQEMLAAKIAARA